jgi:hypothetical protein
MGIRSLRFRCDEAAAKARLEHAFGGVNPSSGLRFECGCPIWLVEREQI